MSREQLFAGFFFAVFLYLLYQFYQIFQFFLGSLSWAALLALIFYPIHHRLVRWLRYREGLAALLLTTIVFLTVMMPMFYLSTVLATESVALYQRVNEAINSGELTTFLESVRHSSVGRLWRRLAPELEMWRIDLASVALRASNVVSAFLVSQVPKAAASVLRFIVSFFLTTFALFFFFRDGARMVGALRDLLPMEPAHKAVILRRIYEALSAVVQGQLVTAVAQGVLVGLAYWMLGVPFVLLLSCATAFLSLLPFGTPVAWLSVVVYLVVISEYTRAVILLLWGVLIISSVDNFVRPLIIGGRTQIPTVFLFFGILGGLQAYGFLGIFFGPALIAILAAFIRIYREEYTAPVKS